MPNDTNSVLSIDSNRSRNIILSFFLFWALITVNGVVFNEIVQYFDIQTGFDNEVFDSSAKVKFIFIVLIFPFLETLIFQHWPARIIDYFGGKNYLIVLVTSILFGLYHFYSWIYIIFGLCAGVIFILFYLRMKKYSFYPLLMTFLLHAAHNGVGFVMFELL
tara:strand:+ start:58 stop:543 length:486 start_codon:yes stop_codon:yes gene_type:complete